MEPANGQLRVGLAEGGLLSADSSRNPGGTADAGRVVREACRRFARDVDWQHRTYIAPGGGEDPGPGWRLSENHEGLHSGRYISVHVVPAANSLVVRGGYYDHCRQPQPVYRQYLPLGDVTAQGLGSLLREMHDGLGDHAGRRST
jgi:hypothetical protein